MKMNSRSVVILAIVALGILCILRKPDDAEGYPGANTFKAATLSELQQLGQLTNTCHMWAGIVGFNQDGTPVCLLPKVITNQQMLNYQLAGKMCDLQYMHDTQGCRVPNQGDPNPYAYDVSRGYFRLF